MFVLCLLFSVLFLLPTVLTITNSFMSEAEIKSNYGMVFSTTTGGFVSKTVNLKFIPDKVTLSQYITGLIKSPEYLLKLWNSILLVVPIVILQVGVASVAAYSFTRWRGKIRSGIFFFYVILMLMPYQVTLVPNYLISQWLGILNKPWAIILPGIFAPFSVFLLTKFMRRIPYSLIEAAKVDGAGEWEIFTRVCLPQCRSACTPSPSWSSSTTGTWSSSRSSSCRTRTRSPSAFSSPRSTPGRSALPSPWPRST